MTTARDYTSQPDKMEEAMYHIQELRYYTDSLQAAIKEVAFDIVRCEYHVRQLEKLKEELC